MESSERDYYQSDGRANRNEDFNTNTDLLEEVKNIIEWIDESEGNKDDDYEEANYDYLNLQNDYKEVISSNEKRGGGGRYFRQYRPTGMEIRKGKKKRYD